MMHQGDQIVVGQRRLTPGVGRRMPPVHPVGPWHCQYPGCQEGGIGYVNKKACGSVHRNWLWRQKQQRMGRVRTRYGYKTPINKTVPPEPARKSA